MPYQRLEDILRPTTTPEQANFLNWFYSYFNIGGNVAHRTILNVEPLFYEGVIAGTEFLVYSATKLYVVLQTVFSAAASSDAIVQGIRVYNNLNVLSAGWTNCTAGTGIPPNVLEDVKNENYYFSRFDAGDYLYVLFNGYRITLN